MRKKTKMAFKGYYTPTPMLFRKFGDALLGVSAFVQTYAIVEEIKWLAILFLFIGVVGKFLSNFFTELEVSEEIKHEGES